MNEDSIKLSAKGEVAPNAPPRSPILIVPYMWIGDFVRCHSVVKVLRARWPDRPVDLLTNTLCAPLIDYMPGVRKGVEWNLPRKRLPLGEYHALAERLRRENYGTALVMLRTWKSALAPFFAGIPERTGFIGEGRLWLINDVRFGERRLDRMIDRCGALALPKGAPLPTEWPMPEIVVRQAELLQWRARRGLASDTSPIVALAPGAIGPGKKWPTENYAELAKALAQDGATVWILGGPLEKELAADIIRHAGNRVRDLTGNDLRDAILALKGADLAVTNDSGLMHISAAIGTPTIGIFGPTDPRLWGPLNPLAAVIEPERPFARDRSTSEIPPDRVIGIARRHLQTSGSRR
ncbi:MAG TPA: lipopolysaccharide heptosyltransferase II [Xanthobacteraceae bacterium]|nr:lipopolysaccharide heptosyltransferase II [Xanthobacteraceae bacterium]